MDVKTVWDINTSLPLSIVRVDDLVCVPPELVPTSKVSVAPLICVSIVYVLPTIKSFTACVDLALVSKSVLPNLELAAGEPETVDQPVILAEPSISKSPLVI